MGQDFFWRKKLIYRCRLIKLVPYQLIYTADKGQMWQGFNFYIDQSIFVFLVVFVSCAIPFILIVQGTTKRLKRNSQLLHNIAESGDLVSRIDIVVNDDFGLLTGCTNELMDKFSAMITSIKQESDHVSGSAEVLSDAANSSVAALTQMQSSLQKINSQGNEQYTVIYNVSNDITGLAKISERGNSLVTSAINSISEIQTASNEVRSLAESSTKSAKEIQTHIKYMVEKINAGVDTSRQAGEAFKAIEDSVRENQKIMQALTTAKALLQQKTCSLQSIRLNSLYRQIKKLLQR